MDHQAVYLDVLRDVRVADYLGHSILDILDRIAERIGPRLEFAMDLGMAPSLTPCARIAAARLSAVVLAMPHS